MDGPYKHDSIDSDAQLICSALRHERIFRPPTDALLFPDEYLFMYFYLLVIGQFKIVFLFRFGHKVLLKIFRVSQLRVS